MRSAFEACIRAGGVVVFPADTVYGLACDAEDAAAVERLYALKGRPPDKPAAVMFFSLERALAALPELDRRTRGALQALLPGAVTLLLPNPRHRYPLACGPDPDTLGIRAPDLPALAGVSLPVLQSSANHAGRPDARRLADVPEPIRAGADLVLDGGELPGTPSTVIDLRRYEDDGDWRVLRTGAVAPGAVATVLSPPPAHAPEEP
jgi:L-threonylcarbamoyladenylate synthase